MVSCCLGFRTWIWHPITGRSQSNPPARSLNRIHSQGGDKQVVCRPTWIDSLYRPSPARWDRTGLCRRPCSKAYTSYCSGLSCPWRLQCRPRKILNRKPACPARSAADRLLCWDQVSLRHQAISSAPHPRDQGLPFQSRRQCSHHRMWWSRSSYLYPFLRWW